MQKFFKLLILVTGAITMSAASTYADTVYGVTVTNSLIRFDSETPGTIIDSVAISGLQTGESVVGIDFRPANGTLIALGSTSRIYSLNTTSGLSTQVGSTQLSPALTGTEFGVDFNPTVDRLRIVSDADENLRVNPDTGALAATDTNLSYDATDPNVGANPQVVAIAYTTNVSGATATTLFGIDSALDTLVQQGGSNGTPSPNGGVLFTVGALGVDTGTVAGFDISPARSGRALAALAGGSDTQSKLYSIDLGGGRATLIGTIGSSTLVRDIAVVTGGTIDFTSSSYYVNENGSNASVTITRTGTALGSSNITLTTSGGSATAGTDYTSTSTTVTFAEGETSKTISIPIIDDALGETNETVLLTLSNPTGGAIIGGSANATLTILDNDLISTTDTAGPQLLASYDTPTNRDRFLSRGLNIDVSSSEGGTVTAELVIDGNTARRARLGTSALVIATDSDSLNTAGVVPLNLRISNATRARLRRLSSFKVTLRIIGTDIAGNTTTEPSTFTVRR